MFMECGRPRSSAPPGRGGRRILSSAKVMTLSLYTGWGGQPGKAFLGACGHAGAVEGPLGGGRVLMAAGVAEEGEGADLTALATLCSGHLGCHQQTVPLLVNGFRCPAGRCSLAKEAQVAMQRTVQRAGEQRPGLGGCVPRPHPLVGQSRCVPVRGAVEAA